MTPRQGTLQAHRVLGLLAGLCLIPAAVNAAPKKSAVPFKTATVDKRLQWDKKTWGPMVPHTKFTKNCALCHVAKRWDVISKDFHFDHKKETGYQLEGAHAEAACLRCHNDRGPIATYVAHGCTGCHNDPHQGSLGLNCSKCHDQVKWVQPGKQGEKVAQHSRTRFPLTGMHATIECARCHTHADAEQFAGTPLECTACHAKDFQGAKNHVADNFPSDCTKCHNLSSWGSPTMNHVFLGPFAKGSSSNPDCYSCHAADYVRGPNHIAQNFSKSCGECHTETTWLNAGFLHGPKANFATLDCNGCHAAQYAAADPAESLYHAANHVANAFPTQCILCHNPTDNQAGVSYWHKAWNGVNGPGASGPEALGMSHTAAGVPATCYTCHSGAFAGATFPTSAAKHSNGFPTNSCTDCHGVGNYASWGPTAGGGATTKMLHAAAGIPAVACNSCHNGDYMAANPALSGVSTTGNYTTNDANHANAGTPFPTDCTLCHTAVDTTGRDVTKWRPGTGTDGPYGMNHTVGSIGGTAATCYNCHAADFTNGPGHVANAFSHNCVTCHAQGAPTTSTWLGAVYDHSMIGSATCWSCHGPTKMDDTFTGANPVASLNGAGNHKVNGFPGNSSSAAPTVDCKACHNTTAWAPAIGPDPLGMDHTQVASMACTACHQTTFTNGPFPDNASKHSTFGATVAGACATCHLSKKGWGPTVFGPGAAAAMTVMVHGATGVSAIACNTCHNGDYLTANPAASLNAAAKHSPSFPTTCASCHSATDGAPPLDKTKWDLAWTGPNGKGATGGDPLGMNHTVVNTIACSACHAGVFAAGPYPDAASQHVTNGYPPAACATCHLVKNGWGPTVFGPGSAAAMTIMKHAAAGLPGCANCHNAEFLAANPPLTVSATLTNGASYTDSAANHVGNGFPAAACATCHKAVDQAPPAGAVTLWDAMVVTPGDGVGNMNHLAAGLPACYSCHTSDYNATVTPNHVTAMYSTSCKGCHITDGTKDWKNAGFDHSGLTTGQTCWSCHGTGMSSDMFSKATAPTGDLDKAAVHTGAGGGGTLYPNVGSGGSDCTVCHTVPVGIPSNTTVTAWDANTNGGASNRLGMNHAQVTSWSCTVCHQLSATTRAIYDTQSNHNTIAGWPMTNTACVACHKNYLSFGPTSPAGGTITTMVHAQVTAIKCNVCHLTDYNGTTSPAHSGLIANITFSGSLTCNYCHTAGVDTAPPAQTHPETAWNNFAHNPSSCYGPKNGLYSKTSNHHSATCYTCHNSGKVTVISDFTTATCSCQCCHAGGTKITGCDVTNNTSKTKTCANSCN